MEYRGMDGLMASSATPPGSSQVSPKGSPKYNKIKFLCSHGGKILPRPADGHLKYVGGETRVISVPRDINFPTLMKKLTYLIIEGEMILKYQLIPEDLDALVSVKSDEDLRHMFDEYDRHETQGIPRLRAFLFPVNPVIIDNPMEPHALEQRYLDAINGIVRPTTNTTTTPINGHHGYKPSPTTNHTSYSLSSACSSPRSPESYTSEATPQEALLQLQTYQNTRLLSPQIPKVHSSPNLYNLNPQQQPQTPPQGHHQVQQQHHHHYYQQYKQQQQQANHHHHHHHHSYQSNKPPLDPHPHKIGGGGGGIGGGISEKYRLPGRLEPPRYHHVEQASQYYYSMPKHSKGWSPVGGCCNKCRYYDEYSASTDRRIDRAESLPPSPQPQSPQQGFLTIKGWDSAI